MWCIASTRNWRPCARACGRWPRRWRRARVQIRCAVPKTSGRRTISARGLRASLLIVEKIHPDGLVLEDFLARQTLQLVREDQPLLHFAHAVVGYQRAAIAQRLVVDGRRADAVRQIT